MSKFKVGDKVKHKDLGVGEIIGFDINDNQCAVEFEDEYYRLTHNFSRTYMYLGLSNPIDRNTGYWCWDNEIELIEEVSKNLTPLIAKEFGVEIGEEFYIQEMSTLIFRFTEQRLEVKGKNKQFMPYEWEESTSLVNLINGEYIIQKLPKAPRLSDAERVILENLPKEFKWIARHLYKNTINVFYEKPQKRTIGLKVWAAPADNEELYVYNHLFQFIKWDDEKPHNIQELIKEYEELLKGE